MLAEQNKKPGVIDWLAHKSLLWETIGCAHKLQRSNHPPIAKLRFSYSLS